MTVLPKEWQSTFSKWRELLDKEPLPPSPTVGQFIEAAIAVGQKIDRKMYESVWDHPISHFKMEEKPLPPCVVGGDMVEMVVSFTAVPPVKVGPL